MIGYLDCSTGVSGDKLLGALLDVGEASGAFGKADLAKLAAQLAPEAEVAVERVSSHGVAAVGVRVAATEQPTHRTWASIRELVEDASLPEPVRVSSLAAFRALAQAEAEVHGTTVDEVHFHEVGALDALVDVVGVCAGVHSLGIDSIFASPVATGSGTVETSHGTLPVPAPATAALLLGVPTVCGPSLTDGSAAGELSTPTGAALLHALGVEYGVCPPMLPGWIGYGAGTRDIGSPNVCRLTLGEPCSAEVTLTAEQVAVLETNLDHLSAEATAVAAQQLLAEGALDVWQTPVVMKKGRCAVVLNVLVPSAEATDWAQRIVALTATLGVRVYHLERLIAPRETRVVDTPYGPVRFKIGASATRPEADDIARISRETNRSFSSVAEELSDLMS